MSSGGAVPAAGRFLTGLSVGALSLCAAGWLALMPFAFGYQRTGRVALTEFGTGAGLALVAVMMLVTWTVALRRKLRADGVLPSRPARPRPRLAPDRGAPDRRAADRRAAARERRQAKRHARAERLVAATRHTRELPAAPDPAQVLTDLRTLLIPLLASPPDSATAATAGTTAASTTPVTEAVRVVSPPPPAPVAPTPAVPSFLTTDPGSLLIGAELLMVGCGEEETW